MVRDGAGQRKGAARKKRLLTMRPRYEMTLRCDWETHGDLILSGRGTQPFRERSGRLLQGRMFAVWSAHPPPSLRVIERGRCGMTPPARQTGENGIDSKGNRENAQRRCHRSNLGASGKEHACRQQGPGDQDDHSA